ncbi:MAG: PQQ-binding-like beta-propeller repeat protein [Blastocatellia bacterium]
MKSRMYLLTISIGLCAAITTVTGLAQKGTSKAPSKPPAKTTVAGPAWLQWGGPNRNFRIAATGLRESWENGAPNQLWNRALGEGHSSILHENGRLYTMYSNGDREAIIALDAATGRTLWEFGYEAKTQGLSLGEGKGPHSTPLIVGNLLYAVGVRGTMHALDKSNGRMVWKHDLWSEYNGQIDGRGYSPSPLAYKNTVIVPVGGGDGKQCLMSFDRQTGVPVWRNLNFKPSPAAPIMINVGGQDQIVHFGHNEVYGADAATGNLLWSHPHKTDFGLNISTPVWNAADGLLIISSAYGVGTRALQIVRNGDQTTARQAWHNKRMRIHFGTMVRIGDYVYGSSSDSGPAFFTAIHARTGQIAWQERGLARASFLHADGKLVILDEDGTLAIAAPLPSGLNVLAKAPVMKNLAWTAPTLVGTRLFIRDRRTIVALDLG